MPSSSMTARSRRATVAALVALLLAVGAVGAGAAAHAGDAGHAAADDDPGQSTADRCDRGNSSENRADPGCSDDGNSSFGLSVDVGGENPGGEGHYVCEGAPDRNECDKGGELNAGPVGVEYTGDNYMNATGMYGGGGDHFTVTGENRSGSVGFDCDLRQSNVPGDACTLDANSSEGSAPETSSGVV